MTLRSVRNNRQLDFDLNCSHHTIISISITLTYHTFQELSTSQELLTIKDQEMKQLECTLQENIKQLCEKEVIWSIIWSITKYNPLYRKLLADSDPGILSYLGGGIKFKVQLCILAIWALGYNLIQMPHRPIIHIYSIAASRSVCGITYVCTLFLGNDSYDFLEMFKG